MDEFIVILENYIEKLDKMVWSFSRINSFHTCKWMWYLTYIYERKMVVDGIEKLQKLKGAQNGHAESGLLVHKLLEEFAKGNLMFWDLVDEWGREFNKQVKHKFMYNKYVDLKEKAFENGKRYFENFEGFDDIGEVVSIEEKVEIVIYDKIRKKYYKFLGYIDLVLTKDGEYIIVDHKSKSNFKIGNVKGVFVDEQHDYARQLYCYAKYVFEKYGKYPKQLIFNMFSKDEMIYIDFNMEDYEESIQWCCDVIAEAYEETEFEPHVEYMFCNYLCSMREYCKYKDVGRVKKKYSK